LKQPPWHAGTPRLSAPLSRRLLLVSSAATLSVLAVPSWPVRAAETGDARFLSLSRLLIPHRLDAGIGQRIAAELKAGMPPLSDHIDALLDLAQAKNATTVEEFFPFAPDDAKAAALRIISAWYLGVVDDVPGAKIIAYEQALMFQPTSDVMTIPTYAISGPNGWDADAPPLSAMPVF